MIPDSAGVKSLNCGSANDMLAQLAQPAKGAFQRCGMGYQRGWMLSLITSPDNPVQNTIFKGLFTLYPAEFGLDPL